MRQPLRLFALVGVAAVLVLAATHIRGSFVKPRGSSPGASSGRATAPVDTGGDVVARAIDLAKSDSVRLREQWVDEIPDLALASLSDDARATFLRIANGRRCDCGCGFTLAGCRRFDPTCDVSGPRAAALFDSVQSGRLARAGEFPGPPATR
jgi:hypothetical protein